MVIKLDTEQETIAIVTNNDGKSVLAAEVLRRGLFRLKENVETAKRLQRLGPMHIVLTSYLASFLGVDAS